jgi:hypothetical protein
MGERDGQRAQARTMLIFVFASTSAPFARGASTTSKWPNREARCSGVDPSCGAGENIPVSACLRHPPGPLQPARTTTRRASPLGPAPASPLSPASHPPPAPREQQEAPLEGRAPPPPLSADPPSFRTIDQCIFVNKHTRARAHTHTHPLQVSIIGLHHRVYQINMRRYPMHTRQYTRRNTPNSLALPV